MYTDLELESMSLDEINMIFNELTPFQQVKYGKPQPKKTTMPRIDPKIQAWLTNQIPINN